MLAGHTHGGQACLPGGIPIIRHDTLPRRYCRGVNRLFDTWLVVSRGMGFATRQFRVFCPAEVVELVLRPA
jgi:predicted MPP superfamily phosphohydrolase